MSLETILANHDPQLLICAGAPNDEYSPEARKLVERLAPENTLQEIKEVLADVLHSNFDLVYKLKSSDKASFEKVYQRTQPIPQNRSQQIESIAQDIFIMLSNLSTQT
jgi:hypothetical protein